MQQRMNQQVCTRYWKCGQGKVWRLMWLLVFIGLVDGQGPGRGVRGLDPAGHPVMWRPLAAAGVMLLKDLPYEEALFGCGRIERELLTGLLQLRVIHLREKRKIKRRDDGEEALKMTVMCSTSDSMCSCRLVYQDFFRDVIPSLKASFLLQSISSGMRFNPLNASLKRCFSTPSCSDQTSYSVGLQKPLMWMLKKKVKI